MAVGGRKLLHGGDRQEDHGGTGKPGHSPSVVHGREREGEREREGDQASEAVRVSDRLEEQKALGRVDVR